MAGCRPRVPGIIRGAAARSLGSPADIFRLGQPQIGPVLRVWRLQAGRTETRGRSRVDERLVPLKAWAPKCSCRRCKRLVSHAYTECKVRLVRVRLKGGPLGPSRLMAVIRPHVPSPANQHWKPAQEHRPEVRQARRSEIRTGTCAPIRARRYAWACADPVSQCDAFRLRPVDLYATRLKPQASSTLSSPMSVTPVPRQRSGTSPR